MTTIAEKYELIAGLLGIGGHHFVDHYGEDKWIDEETVYDWLHDDGDCARLEAALGIEPQWTTEGVIVSSRQTFPRTFGGADYADHNGDKQAARRAAVVECAVRMARSGK